jgi:HlyD family secretion protein
MSMGLGYVWFKPLRSIAASPQASSAGEWHAVKRGDFEILCREEGELKPVKVTTLTFLRYGKVSFLVPEGTFVKKGEKVVSLEIKELEDEMARFQEDLSTAERALAQQEQTRDLDIKRLNKELLSEKDRTELARLKEREVLAKPLPLDKDEAENTLNSAKARLANAQADLAAVEPLALKGFGKGSDLAAKRLALEKSKVELQRAEMKFKTTADGAKDHEKKQAALQREDAELGLKIKELDVEDSIDSLNAKVKSNQRVVELLERRVEKRQEDLDRSTLYAPHDGIVVYKVVDWRSNKKVEVGETVGPWAAPVELPSFEKMKVRTQVPESFIRQLRPRMQSEGATVQAGSKARVVVKTLPDRVYQAEVTWIDGWARDRNSKLAEADIKAQGLSGVRVFDVEVELDESDTQRLREGFRAAVEFPVDTIKNVIAIPVSAISNRDGAPHVQVNEGENVWRKIELGTQSMDRVVVTSGLNAGDEIFVPRAQTQTQKKKAPAEDEKDGVKPIAKDAPRMPGSSSGPAASSRDDGGMMPVSGKKASAKAMMDDGEMRPPTKRGKGRSK